MSAQKEELPGVSVIIPVYNREQFLAECIQSVLDQKTDFPVEIVCADDGSTDRSKEIALSLGDSIVWLDKPADCKEQGAGPTRNRAIAVARYSYIAFLDSDDIFLPDHLFRLFHFLETHSEFGGAIDQLMGFMDGSKNLWLWKYENADIVQLESFFLNPYFGLQVLMIRHSVIIQTDIRFDPVLRFAQDVDFFIQILEKESIAILPEWGSALRQHDARSTAGSAKQYEYALSVLEKAIKRYPYPKHLIAKRRAAISFRLAQGDCAEKKYISALFRLFYAALLDPIRAIKTVLHIK